jgi:hypothetical protein
MTIITFDTGYLPPHAGVLILRSFPRHTTVIKLAAICSTAEAQLDRLAISNRVYRLDLDRLEEEL